MKKQKKIFNKTQCHEKATSEKENDNGLINNQKGKDPSKDSSQRTDIQNKKTISLKFNEKNKEVNKENKENKTKYWKRKFNSFCYNSIIKKNCNKNLDSTKSYEMNSESTGEKTIAKDYYKNAKRFRACCKNYYDYSIKIPKRPFQKCIEVPSDYRPDTQRSIENKENNQNQNILIRKELEKIVVNTKTSKINMKKEEHEKEKSISRNIKILFEECNKKRKKNNQNKNKEERKNSKVNEEESLVDNERKKNENEKEEKNKEPETEKKNIDKERESIKKKYLSYFFGCIRRYSETNPKKISFSENVEKEKFSFRRKNSKDSDSVTSFCHLDILLNEKENNNLNFVCEKKINEIFIPSCYSNPYRSQYLEMVKKNKNSNENKIFELILPPPTIFPPSMNPFIQSYSNYYQYNNSGPYLNTRQNLCSFFTNQNYFSSPKLIYNNSRNNIKELDNKKNKILRNTFNLKMNNLI